MFSLPFLNKAVLDIQFAGCGSVLRPGLILDQPGQADKARAAFASGDSTSIFMPLFLSLPTNTTSAKRHVLDSSNALQELPADELDVCLAGSNAAPVKTAAAALEQLENVLTALATGGRKGLRSSGSSNLVSLSRDGATMIAILDVMEEL